LGGAEGRRRFAPEVWDRSASRPYLSFSLGAAAPVRKGGKKGGQSKIPDSFLNNNCYIALKSVRIFLGMHFIQSELFHLKKA
jgi:hypothetical protein